MKPNRFSLILILLVVAINGFGQQKPSKIAFNGYLKNMSTFIGIGDSLWYENLTHNRLNFSYYPTDNLTIYAEMRNRILTGDFVKYLQPYYGDIIDGNNDYFTLSSNLIDNKDVVFNTMIDRIYLQWNKNNWELKMGRQRINWGMNLAWNPNDLFNAYSFFDFDYEERRGSDALRVKYYTGAASSIEIASKIADDVDHFVAAGMWKLNKWDYDFQLLSGVAHGDVAIGAGWAGNIKLMGFKGELTYLSPFKKTVANQAYDQLFIGSFSVDYSFKSSLYLNGSLLYNSHNPVEPVVGLGRFSTPTTSDFTIRDLSTYRWSAFVQSAYEVTPLIYASVSVMTFPGTNALFVNPALSFSLSQNTDLGIFGQLYFDEDPGTEHYTSQNPSGFLRLKWSF